MWFPRDRSHTVPPQQHSGSSPGPGGLVVAVGQRNVSRVASGPQREVLQKQNKRDRERAAAEQRSRRGQERRMDGHGARVLMLFALLLLLLLLLLLTPKRRRPEDAAAAPVDNRAMGRLVGPRDEPLEGNGGLSELDCKVLQNNISVSGDDAPALRFPLS